MPRRTAIMHDDAIHAPIATGSAALIYGWTLQEVVLILWAAYVLILIVIKLPDLTASVVRIRQCVMRRWNSIRRKDGFED